MKLALIALLTGCCFAQEAKIMIVERSDSQRLSKAYQEYKDALKRWEEAKAQVSKQYTFQNGKAIEGWEKVQFSADFRAIVPEVSQYAGRLNCWGASTVTPANGIIWADTSISRDVVDDLKVKEK